VDYDTGVALHRVVTASLTGDWKSTTPPDFSRLLRIANRASDITVELKTKDADMRLVKLTDVTPPRMALGEGGSWVLDYAAQVPAGSWIFGVNRDDLQSCGALDMTLYGIDRNATRDGVVAVNSVAVTFLVNAIPTYRCEYRPNVHGELPEPNGPVRLHIYGPISIQKIP
jgi:hypothetical protein